MSFPGLIRSILAAAILSVSAVSATAASTQPAPDLAPVSSSRLGALDLWSSPGRETGLGSDLWRGSSAPLVAHVLEGVGSRPISPAIAAMARRVLATGAAAPDGGGADPELAALRARALIALGDPAAAFSTLSRAPRVEASEPLSRAKAEAALFTGQDASACDTAQALEQNRDGSFWRKLRVFCATLGGRSGAAQVALDLWRQAGGKDQAFDRLAGAAASGAGDKVGASLADPVDLALSRRFGLDPGPQLETATPAAIAAVVQSSGFSPTARAQAVAAGLRQGLVSGDQARTLYAPAVAPTGDPEAQIAELAKGQGEGGGAAADAQLFRIATRGADPMARDQAAMALLGRGRYAGGFKAMAELLAPALPEIARTGAPLSDPIRFAAAAAAAGDTATADLVRGRIDQEKTPGANPRSLALLDALIAAGSGRAAGPVLDRLAEQAAGADTALKASSGDAALMLMALGQPLTPAARAEIAELRAAQPLSPPARLLLMARDGADRIKGETAMLALAVGEDQPIGPSQADRARIVAALGAAGLHEDARAIAVESLLVLFLARP